MKKYSDKSMVTILVASIMVLTSCSSPVTGPDNGIGLQLWSLREDMKKDPVATIEKVGEMGYDYIESAGYSDGKIYGMEPEEFKSLVEENGMLYLGAHSGKFISESGNWQELMPWWDQCIATHKATGAEYIIHPNMGKSGFESLEGLAAYCAYFNAIGEKCNEAGLRFGFHNHAREFGEIDGVVIYDYMLENTDPEKVMFQLDIYWIYEGGKDPADYFTKYPDRFESIHIKDVKELGESGTIDFKKVLDQAQEIGPKYYIVEVEKYNFEPVVSVEKSLEYLKEIGFAK
jgi:sugar phosphate isomerase/epimerase